MQNWRTSLIGALAGALMIATGHDLKSLITAFALALIGILAKDFNAKI